MTGVQTCALPIWCPKLDDVDYSEKLTEIIKNNDIKSVTITRMEVTCCGGIEMAAKKALHVLCNIVGLVSFLSS